MDTTFCALGIAIHKEAYTKLFLAGEMPNLIRFLSGKPYEDALYWFFEDVDWPTTKAHLLPLIHRLEQESQVDIYVTHPGQVKIPLYSKACFGVIRLGDDPKDSDTWGSPNDYQMFIDSSINLPIH